MNIKALVIEEDTNKNSKISIKNIDQEQLPKENVTVNVEYSTLNYKDGLCMSPGGAGLVRSYPHIPGIDMSGTVESSEDDRYKAGDKVILTGWKYGEKHWGGYTQKTNVNADWLVPVPKGLSTKNAMIIGTAGLTSMLSIIALEKLGLRKENGPVLVTGATGGVGSIALIILSNLGYDIAAVTGKKDNHDYLKELGAQTIIDRDDINSIIHKPLESEMWSGCIDSVGGNMLSRILGQIKYGGSLAAVGLAGGAKISTSVIPFLLRSINLIGIDSVMMPYQNRINAWDRIVKDVPMEKLDKITTTASLEQIPELGKDIIKGKIKGRVLVNLMNL